MHIITYNIQRLTPFKNLEAIQQLLLQQNADILILTESDTRCSLPGYHTQHSNYVHQYKWGNQVGIYKDTERRISILSKYPFKRQIATFDSEVALAYSIDIEGKELIIYGTVLGVTGKNDSNFQEHLNGMMADWQKLSTSNNLCIAGDFNISFADNYYTNTRVRSMMQDFFLQHGLINVTAGLPRCIDHIVLSAALLERDDKTIHAISVGTFGEEKLLSDHAGVWVKVD